MHIGLYDATVQYSKTCISNNYNVRIDGKIENKFLLSISSLLCYKITMLLGPRNGPLKLSRHFIHLDQLAKCQNKCETKSLKLRS